MKNCRIPWAILAGVSVLFASVAALAAPAPPQVVDLSQADGSTFAARLFGDERLLTAETLDGYTVVFDEADRNWCYAVLGPDGVPKSSGMPVGTVAPGRLGLAKHVRHTPEAAAELRSKRLAGGAGVTANGLLPGEKATVYPVAPSIGVRPVLVVLVDFAPDLQAPHVYTATQFNSLLFTDGTHPTGSFRDYYREVSYDKYQPYGAIVGWVTMPQTYSYYVNNAQGLGAYPNNSQGLLVDVVNAIDAAVDFSSYDSDGDGVCDGIILVTEGSATGASSHFWPHMWSLGGNAQVLDGVTIDQYCIVTEQYQGAICPVGLFCHEWGHVLGAPDLYDYDDGDYTAFDDNNYPVAIWDLMDMGMWCVGTDGRAGTGPAHFLGYTKWRFYGWMRPVLVTAPGTYYVKHIGATNHTSLYRIDLPDHPNEFFLLENRNIGHGGIFDRYDQYGGHRDSGLLIYHVDSIAWDGTFYFNDGQPGADNYAVQVVDPGEPSDLTEWPYQLKLDAPFSDDDDQVSLTPASWPCDSSAFDFERSDIWITQISHDGALMSFNYTQHGGLQVVRPNQTDTWKTGAQELIKWEHFNIDGGLLIEYSADGGQTWEAVATVSPADREYLWTIPVVPTCARCLVRITSAQDEDVTAQSTFFGISNKNSDLAVRVTGIDFSNEGRNITVTYEANQPVSRYYASLHPIQSSYYSLTQTSVTYTSLQPELLPNPYYLFIVTAKDSEGVFPDRPARMWIYVEPWDTSGNYDVRISSIRYDEYDAYVDLATTEATNV